VVSWARARSRAEAVEEAEVVVVVGRVLPEEVFDWLVLALGLWEIGAAKVTGMDLRFFPMA